VCDASSLPNMQLTLVTLTSLASPYFPQKHLQAPNKWLQIGCMYEGVLQGGRSEHAGRFRKY
jgi:hypothetical protein